MITSASLAFEMTEFNFLGSLRLPIFPCCNKSKSILSQKNKEIHYYLTSLLERTVLKRMKSYRESISSIVLTFIISVADLMLSTSCSSMLKRLGLFCALLMDKLIHKKESEFRRKKNFR